MYDFAYLIILTMPLGIFATFGLLVFVTLMIKHAKLESVFKRILFFYCLLASIASFLLIPYYYSIDLFRQFDILYGVSVIFAILLFHHMLCFTIRFDKPFGIWRYIIAGLACVGMLLCRLFFSELWEEEGVRIILIVTLLFGIVYSMLTLIDVHRHQLSLAVKLNTTETIDKTKAIPFIVEIFLFPWVFAVCPLMTGHNPNVFSSLLLMVSILLALRMNIPLTYAMIRHYATPFNSTSLLAARAVASPSGKGRIVLNEAQSKHNGYVEKQKVSAKNDKGNLKRSSKSKLQKREEEQPVLTKGEAATERIDKKQSQKNKDRAQLVKKEKKILETYFRTSKPYLDPHLTIHDLADSLRSNRTYLSKFVNETYGLNFNSYINMWRLQEMEHLIRLAQNKDIPPASLATMAGFASYRNYLRAKKMHENKK